MACPDFEERLVDYDELSSIERAAVDAHVAGCAECSQFFSVLREMDAALTAAFADRQVSPVLAARVRQELRRPSIIPEILDGAGWAAVIAIVLWLTTLFVPGLEFSTPAALTIGTIMLIVAACFSLSVFQQSASAKRIRK